MNYKEEMSDANNLYDAFLKSVQGSKWKETSQKFALNFLRQIFALQTELRNQTYVPSQEGRFTLRERGKVRQITSLQPRDRIVRHVLCDVIVTPEVIKKLIYDNGSSIKGKGIAFANKRFKAHLRKYYMSTGSNQGYILFGDFSKFYDNIIHEIAKNQILDLFDHDEYLVWLLDLIFTNFRPDVSYMSDEEFKNASSAIFDKGKHRQIPKELLIGEKFLDKSVNIGDQLSQIIGVFYPHEIDNYVKTVRSQKYYGRYMDDWYIMSSSKAELLDIYEGIKVIAKRLGIFINEKKTYVTKMDRTYKYLQVKYSLTDTGKIIERVNSKRIAVLRRKLKKLRLQVDEGRLDYENVEAMFRGWMGSYYRLLSKDQRRNLLFLFEELFHRRIEIINGKMKFFT